MWFSIGSGIVWHSIGSGIICDIVQIVVKYVAWCVGSGRTSFWQSIDGGKVCDIV